MTRLSSLSTAGTLAGGSSRPSTVCPCGVATSADAHVGNVVRAGFRELSGATLCGHVGWYWWDRARFGGFVSRSLKLCRIVVLCSSSGLTALLLFAKNTMDNAREVPFAWHHLDGNFVREPCDHMGSRIW